MVSSEKIEQIIFGIKDNKALGSDGFSMKFFKKAWKIKGKDVVITIHYVFLSESLL